MVIYEVTAAVELEYSEDTSFLSSQSISRSYWNTCWFTNAFFERSGAGQYRIRYEESAAEELSRYLADDAPRLRRDFAERFPTGVDLSLVGWTAIQSFP